MCAHCLHRGGSACPCSGPLAQVYMLRVCLLACIQCMCVSDQGSVCVQVSMARIYCVMWAVSLLEVGCLREVVTLALLLGSHPSRQRKPLQPREGS